MSTRRVAIVGGGISGLTAAYRLQPYCASGEIAVDLFEAQDRLGGVIRTDRPMGLVLEEGPDSLLRRKPEAERLCRELGLESDLIGISPRVSGAYIFHDGRMHPIPAGTLVGVPTELKPLWRSDLFSWSGKLRAVADLFLPRYRMGPDRGLGRFLRYRFGNQVVARLVEPMLSGVYAGDADQLSLLATFPQLGEMETRHRSLIMAGQAAKKGIDRNRPRTSPFLTLASGMETLIRALSDRITPVAVHPGMPVKTLAWGNGQWRIGTDGGQREYDAVILATPAFESARLIAPLDSTAAAILGAIPYTNLAVVGLVYRPEDIPFQLDKTGFLVPKGEGLEITACTWVGAKWAYAESSPYVAVRAFLGRAGQDILSWSDEAMLERVAQDLKTGMGIAAAPRYARVYRQRQAMPQYLVGHPQRIGQIFQRMAVLPGLWLTGSAYDGVGVPDSIRHAEETVDRLLTPWGFNRQS